MPAMKIIVIGASHGIGRETVRAALAQGHSVTAFARHPDDLDIRHPKLKRQIGDVLDAQSVEQAIAGHDAVICTLGLPTRQAVGPPFAKPSYVLSAGVKNILQAMQAASIKRLLCVTAIGAGDSAAQCTPVARLVLRRGLRWLFREKDRQEQLIRASRSDWTIIRPTALTNGPAKGAVVGPDLRSGLLTQVSRADVATMMLGLISQQDSYGQTLAVSYPARFGDSLRWIAGYFGKG